MEYSVIQLDLSSKEIKPGPALEKYSALVENWNRANQGAMTARSSCIACDSKSLEPAFEKLGVPYVRCTGCRTLFASKAPSDALLAKYFQESDARKHWFSEIGSKTDDVRVAKLVKPLIEWATTHMEENQSKLPAKALDYRPTHSSFTREAARSEGFRGLGAIEPLFPPGDAKLPAASSSGKADLDAVFLLQAPSSAFQPKDLFTWAASQLRKGGFAFLTPLLSTGLDVEVGGAALPGLIPPDHLNLFSFEGLKGLAERSGFQVVEFSTPGVLDAKHLEWMASEPSLRERMPAFLRYWMKNRPGEGLLQDLQEFLQKHRLSSLGRVALRKN